MEAESGNQNLIVLKGLEGNEAAVLNAGQKILKPYSDSLQIAWGIIWVAVLLVILLTVIRYYRFYKE